jgi:hypothetical protein
LIKIRADKLQFFRAEVSIMQRKDSRTFNHLLLSIHKALQEHLMKDFSESLAFRIIDHNVRKHLVGTGNRQEYAKIINAIVSDYQAIKPLGPVDIADLKKELHNAVRQIEH